MKKEGFKISNGTGFHITFANGITVSVQFGYATYSGNKDNRELDFRKSIR